MTGARATPSCWPHAPLQEPGTAQARPRPPRQVQHGLQTLPAPPQRPLGPCQGPGNWELLRRQRPHSWGTGRGRHGLRALFCMGGRGGPAGIAARWPALPQGRMGRELLRRSERASSRTTQAVGYLCGLEGLTVTPSWGLGEGVPSETAPQCLPPSTGGTYGGPRLPHGCRVDSGHGKQVPATLSRIGWGHPQAWPARPTAGTAHFLVGEISHRS